MQRVVILGRGASGKSTLGRTLGAIAKLPVIELDKLFWQPGLLPTPRESWSAVQEQLAAREQWIMDGDLGPYDVVEPRLRRADTVILLDFSFVRCAWRAMRRARERADFWRWLLAYRRTYLPLLRQAIARHAPGAQFLVFHDPRATERFINEIKHNRSRPDDRRR